MKSSCKEQSGACLHQKRFLSPPKDIPVQETPGGAEGQTPSPVDWLFPLYSTKRRCEHQDAAMVCTASQASPWANQPLDNVVSTMVTQGRHKTCQIMTTPSIQDIWGAPGKISFLGKIPAKCCWSDSIPGRFCTYEWVIDSLLPREVTVSGHARFSPEIPAPQETPIAQGSCQRVWAEAETMGLAWELLWFLQR